VARIAMLIATHDGQQAWPDDWRVPPVDGEVIELDELNNRGDTAFCVVPARLLRPHNTGWGRM
jgi:hypothetical protein